MVEVGRICPACGNRMNALLLFQVAPGRFVCGECFDKVRTVEKEELRRFLRDTPHPDPSEGPQ